MVSVGRTAAQVSYLCSVGYACGGKRFGRQLESQNASTLEPDMEASGERIHRTAVPVVGGVRDELVVEADAHVGCKRVAVISLEDFFEPGIRQLSVADEDAQAAGVEKRLVNAADTVDDTRDTDGIVRPAPVLAVDRDAARHRPVAVGKVPRLDVGVGPAGAGEDPDRVRDLLLQVHADSGTAGIASHRNDVGGLTGDLGERDGVLVSSRPAAVEEARDLELAGLTPQFVALLDFREQRVLLKGRVEDAAVG